MTSLSVTDLLETLAAQVHGGHAEEYLRQLRATHPEADADRLATWIDTLAAQASSDLPMAVIFDLDGTLLDGRAARRLLSGPTRDVDAYHAAVAEAPPLAAVLAVHKAVTRRGFAVVVLTSRMERNRVRSVRWLNDNAIDADALFMRADGDLRDDYAVKGDLYQRIREHFNVVHALDDNPDVLRLWADLGVAATTVPNFSYGDDVIGVDDVVEVRNFLDDVVISV